MIDCVEKTPTATSEHDREKVRREHEKEVLILS